MLAPGNETSVHMLLLYPMIAGLGPSSPVFWCNNTPLSRKPTVSIPGQQDDCVRGPCPRGSLARQFAAACLLRTLIPWLVLWLHLSAVVTKLRQGLGARGPPSQTGRTGHRGGDLLSPGLSHWNFVITEWNPRHGVSGAGCPSCPFSFLVFASQLLSKTRSQLLGQRTSPALCPLCSAPAPLHSPACFVLAPLLTYCPPVLGPLAVPVET